MVGEPTSTGLAQRYRADADDDHRDRAGDDATNEPAGDSTGADFEQRCVRHSCIVDGNRRQRQHDASKAVRRRRPRVLRAAGAIRTNRRTKDAICTDDDVAAEALMTAGRLP